MKGQKEKKKENEKREKDEKKEKFLRADGPIKGSTRGLRGPKKDENGANCDCSGGYKKGI